MPRAEHTPTPKRGDRVTVRPGTQWAGRRINPTHVFIVETVTDVRETTRKDDDVVIALRHENAPEHPDPNRIGGLIHLHPRQVQAAHPLMGRRVKGTANNRTGIVIAVMPKRGAAALFVRNPDGATWTAAALLENLRLA